MLGGRWKAVAGGSALGLLATALTAIGVGGGPARAGANTCVLADSTVASVSLYERHAGQPSSGTWTDVDNPAVSRPWYGLYYPFTDPDRSHAVPHAVDLGPNPSVIPYAPLQSGDRFQWRLTGTCKDTGASFQAAGEGVGYRGRSVGVGDGWLDNRTHFVVRWESSGTQLVLLDPSATGTLNAQANLVDSATNSCEKGTATQFTVTGAVAGVS